MRRPGFAILALVAAALLSACAGSGPSSRGVVAQEARASQIHANDLRKNEKLVTDRALKAYVDEIVARIDAARPPGALALQSFIVRDADVNAYTTGGGYVFVNAGLIAAMENEAQLAMVIAHEIAHIDEGHVQAGKQTGAAIGIAGALGAIGLGVLGVPSELTSLGVGLAQTTGINYYTRGQESAADVTGFRYLTRAGYNAAEGAQSFRVLRRLFGNGNAATSFFLSSHPQSSEREALLTRMARAQGADRGRVAAQEYLRRTSKLRRDVLRYYEATGRAREASQLRRNMQALR